MGSAITYFRRYALAAISQTVADDDDDGNAASEQPKAKTQKAKPKPAAQSTGEWADQKTTPQAPEQPFTPPPAPTTTQASGLYPHGKDIQPPAADAVKGQCRTEDARCVVEGLAGAVSSGAVANIIRGKGYQNLKDNGPSDDYKVAAQYAQDRITQCKFEESKT